MGDFLTWELHKAKIHGAGRGEQWAYPKEVGPFQTTDK